MHNTMTRGFCGSDFFYAELHPVGILAMCSIHVAVIILQFAHDARMSGLDIFWPRCMYLYTAFIDLLYYTCTYYTMYHITYCFRYTSSKCSSSLKRRTLLSVLTKYCIQTKYYIQIFIVQSNIDYPNIQLFRTPVGSRSTLIFPPYFF